MFVVELVPVLDRSRVNICGIHLTEIHSDMPTALEILQIVYLSLLLIIFLIFETIALPVTTIGRSHFVSSLMCQSEISFTTYELYKTKYGWQCVDNAMWERVVNKTEVLV